MSVYYVKHELFDSQSTRQLKALLSEACALYIYIYIYIMLQCLSGAVHLQTLQPMLRTSAAVMSQQARVHNKFESVIALAGYASAGHPVPLST